MFFVLIGFLLVVTGALLYCIIRNRSLEDELSAYRKSDKMKSVFIKSLGREIRTLLHTVSGLAEIIAREDLYLSKDEKKTISSQIMYNTGMITTLLDEVGIYTENGSGHPIVEERFSPNQLLQRCLDGNRSQAAEGVRLVFRRELGDDKFVSADRHIVELVLNKLIYSACKFTKKGEISVSCHGGGAVNKLTFCVQDTGDGVPMARQNHLFDWFENPEDMKNETEFDLSVAQRLASKIGGYLRYDSLYKMGTRMEFVIPMK